MARPSADLIRGIPIFASLDDRAAERLAGEFSERTFEPGHVIASEGESGQNFFIVGEGEARVTVGGEEVGTLRSGDSFGEIALVDKSARTATVTATTPMRCYALPVWSFRPFAQEHPDVSWALLELLAERLRAAEAR
ncbi:MAG: cyclic nucleotide-binding domain-containing protein [Actinomycetota bacterium]|nr:cyclic nucleotide-binding domain-containing protein [Actinomycetota bacterium]